MGGLTRVAPADGSLRTHGQRLRGYALQYGVWVALVLLAVVAGLLSPAFFTPVNLFNVVRQASVVGIAAVGLTYVVMTRGIDVSIAGVITVVAVAATAVMNGSDQNIPTALAVSVAIGLAVGTFNGLLVSRGIHPFILTLGVGVVLLGLTQLYTGGTSLGIPAPSFRQVLNSRVGPVPVLALGFLAVAVAGIALMRRSAFGHRVLFIGANPLAARLSGIRTTRYIMGVYVVSGFAAALAGLTYLARSGPPSNFTGMGLEFEALAAVVLGGTTFAGGVGGVAGTVAGALTLAVAFNLVNILGLPTSSQLIVRGGVIVLIAAAYALARRGQVADVR